jgi:hypothetical protein
MVVSAAVAHRIPAGWYRDRDDRSLRRWWDGVTWTDYYSPYTRPIPVSAEATVASECAIGVAPVVAPSAEPVAERHPLTVWRTVRRYLPLSIAATLIVVNVVLTIILATAG